MASGAKTKSVGEQWGLRKMTHFSNTTNYRELEPWVRAQIKAFTGWANSHLSERQIDETKLGFELSNGVALNELLAALEERQLYKYHKTPKLRYHKIENLDWVIKFLKSNGELLVGQDAHALSDDTTNLKMMLGLLWKLIIRYSLKKKYITWPPPGQEKTEPSPKRKGSPQKQEDSATQALLGWVNSALADSCQKAGMSDSEVPKAKKFDIRFSRWHSHISLI